MNIFVYPSESAEKKMASIANRSLDFDKKDITRVADIVEDVKKNKDKALIKYVNQFDSPNVNIETLKVTSEEVRVATNLVDKRFLRTLNLAVKQIKSYHSKQLKKSWIDVQRPGTLVGQLVNPVDAAGIYVPGGKGGNTPLISSVLMGAIPAAIAGVKEIIMTTPPTFDGTVNPYLIVAAKKVGIKDIYKAGSAWAIAALAYGTETIPKVNIIAGPGNIYVTLAKKILAGTVGIDMIAGPSEILIIADQNANPKFIAADLLSQAEHDPLASSILATNCKELATAVLLEVKKQILNLERREIAKHSIEKYGAIMVTPDIPTAIELSNRIAPEHLELHIQDPFDHIGMIKNAGAVFIGEYTPEPVGDYIAGPNHVLPTAGTARFSSALSVDHFIKKTSLIHYSKKAFEKEAKDIICFSELEGLDGHTKSIKIRMEKQKK
jgi:histidinol dehydrogenase